MKGWRVSQPYPFSKQQEFTDRMVKEIAAIPRMPVKHVPQHASTLLNLEAQKDPYYKRDWCAPLSEGVIAVKDAKNIDEAVGRRMFDPMEIAILEQLRRSGRGHTLGESKESGTTDESRERAEHHFLVSPPAQLTEADKRRIVGLIEIASAAPVEVWKKISWPRAVWHWITGHKVKSVKAPEGGWRE